MSSQWLSNIKDNLVPDSKSFDFLYVVHFISISSNNVIVGSINEIKNWILKQSS